MYKKHTKIISILLTLALVMSMCCVAAVSVSAAAGETYTVAGDSGLTGVEWDPASNVMDDNGDGTYSLTFTDVPAGSYGFKVTDGTWENSWGKDGGNYTITLSDTCDVTVNFDSDAKTITVDAEFLSSFVLEYIIAVGNGEGTWLNGANWDLTDETNKMTEVEPGIWEITYTDVEDFDNYQVKFACNGSWQPYNWTIDGVLDGQENTPQVVEVFGSTVTLRLDVNGFDFNSGTGTVVPQFIVTPPATEPVPTETTPVPTETEPVPTETEPVPTETEPVPTETEPVPTETTPDDKQFTVTAKSNMAEPVSQTYNEQDKTVTVTYLLKTDRKVCNGQWSVIYDPSVLKFNRAAMTDEEGYEICCPIVEKRGGYVWKLFDFESMGIANGNFSNVSTFYDFTNEDINKDILFQGTFDIVGDYTKDTEINFDLQVLSIGEKDENGQTRYDVYAQDSILNDKFTSNCETKILLSEATPLPTETEPVPTETTPVPTEPVPTETTPVPTEPVPTETTPVPTEPVPTETTPVPTEPVPTETTPVPTEPVPTETTPVPTEPVPTETTPVPTEPVPTETTPVPTEPVPTETTPVPTEPASEVEPTTATEPGATDATETVPAATSGATSDVATPDTPSSGGNVSGGGTVQTSDTSAAMILFIVMAAATAFIIVVRKKELDK